MTDILGAILAGGRSRRFGSDKAVALLDGQRLIDRAIAALRPQVDTLIVCGRTMADTTCVADLPGPDMGPLGGLNAALRHARDHGFRTVITVPCDAPFLPPDLVARLLEPGCATFARTMPVIGCWPATLANLLCQHLATATDRSMRLWAEIAGALPVDVGEMPNINTAADLRLIATGRERLARHHRGAR